MKKIVYYITRVMCALILCAGLVFAGCKEGPLDDDFLAQPGDYVDEYGINHGQGVKIGGTVWAPVNCGYHKDNFKYGKLYQWGRKYGQGYSGLLYDKNENIIDVVSDATIPIIEEGGVSIITGTHEGKANVFLTSTSEYNSDWLYPQDDKLWNSGTELKPVKTEYDPCPDGWRIPTYAELSDLSKNYSLWTTNENGQVGYWFSGANSYSETVPRVFFPASGSRNYNDGDAGSRGHGGLYWSSRPFQFNTHDLACYLGFHRNRDVFMFYCYRAYGCSVRCVQE